MTRLQVIGRPAWRTAWGMLAVFAVLSTTGCAAQLRLMDRSAGVGATTASPGIFWPPPWATQVALAEAGRGSSVSLGDAAVRVASVLGEAGYVDKRWYPIGVHCAHGFAVTTRLESLEPGSARARAKDRWSTLFPQPVTLKWLGGTLHARLPGAGRYRAYLVAFSDLHVRQRGQAPRLDETTLMESVDGSITDFPAALRVPSTFRFGAYLYEYEALGPDGDGVFLGADDRAPATEHLRESGLARLLRTEKE